MRFIVSIFLAVLAVVGCAQFKVDPQKIPIVQAKRRALVIGANNYEYLGKLSYAASDAERFRDALKAGFGFTDDSVQLISDAPTNPLKPVRSTILAELNKMLADPILDKGDMFILYFSGHGTATGGRDYLCSTNTKASDVAETALPVEEIIDKLVKAGLRNVVIIADACRSGDKNEFGEDLYNQAKKANVAVLLGCSPGQKSYEIPLFKSGAFTYFLLKALSNPKVRTESGGLWTSKVAKSVEDSVFEYTQHDYGDNAQRPKSFADPTSDVMLAKFVSRSETGVKNEDLEMVPDRSKVSDQLVEIGAEELANGDFAKALESNKQALTLNPENLFAAYYATISTSYLGRNGEHEKFCDFLKQSSKPYFRNLGYVQSDSRATSIADRLKALDAYWDASPKDELHAIIVWSRARTYASMESTKSLIQKIIPSLEKGTRVRTFFEGEVFLADNKPESALEKYRAALKLPAFSTGISDEILILLQINVLFELRRNDELKVFLKEQFGKEKVSPLVWSSAATYLRLLGNRDAAIAIVKKGLKESNLSEDILVLCAITLGLEIVNVVDDLDNQVKLLPYSWKAKTVALIARGVRDKDAALTAKAFEEASRYCDDELQIISLTYKINDAILRDAKSQRGMTDEQSGNVYEMFRLLFQEKIDKFGTDTEKWCQLGRIGLDLLHGPDTLHILKTNLKDYSASSALGAEFFEILFQLATSMEDLPLVELSVNNPSLTEPTRSDVRIQYAAFLSSRGEYAKAQTVANEIKEVSASNLIIKKSLDAIFAARSGKPAELSAFLAQQFEDKVEAIVARGIAALALSDLGKNDEALSHLAAVSEVQPTIVVSVPYRCLQRYLSILKSKGKVAESDDALFNILKFNQSSPGVANSFFGAKPGIENFATTYKAVTRWVSDELFDQDNPTHKNSYLVAAIGDGQIELSIAKDGTVSGSLKVVGGEDFVLSGKVDQFGNLKGIAKSPKQQLEIGAKLVSNDFRNTETFKKSSIGQLVNFYNEKGIAIHWMLPAAVLKP